MKKVGFFIIFVGVIVGLFLGVRQTMLKRENSEEVVNEVVSKIYVDEINLPLIETDTLNPLLTENKQVSDVLKLIYEPLISYDSDNSIKDSLAANWMEKDHLTWIITLRKNVKWHSDKNFTSEDVKFSINTILNNENSTYYDNAKNIESIEIIDNNAVQINLKERDIFFPYKLTFPIIPKYYFYEDIKNIDKLERPIGTGAYKYVHTSEDSKRITLEFNNNWWKDITPKLKKIYIYKYSTYGEAIKAFKSNEIDVISTSMYSWQKKFGSIGINSYSFENPIFETIIPNTTKNGLDESSVRRAILYATNRSNIITEVYDGNANVHDVMIHGYSWLYDKDLETEFDIEKSKQLLINAGWEQTARWLGKEGKQ